MKNIFIYSVFIFSIIFSIDSFSQNSKSIDYTVIAEGNDSPIGDLQIVCYNKYFNLDYLPTKFTQKYNLTDKKLFKKKMLIELFANGKENGIDNIELVDVRNEEDTIIIEYNTFNSDSYNDKENLSPFLIIQVEKTKAPLRFILNGKTLGESSEVYITN